MNRKKTYLAIVIVAVVIILSFFLIGSDNDDSRNIVVDVQHGKFRIEVNTTGELEARNSTYIMGPSSLRKYRIYQVNIQSIIPEGTYVKKGQFVASLDPSELNSKIKDSQIQVEDKETKMLQTRLDTALQMREARDKLYNLEFAVQEKELIMEQSQYEPPATIKKAEIELEKAVRQLAQERENYKIKKQQNVAKMQIAQSSLKKERLDMDEMLELQRDFNIKAPEDGMLIYRKGWDGRPMKEGSQINTWDPVVATLPDLSSMNSVTYVNEVDIRRIKQGQIVEIGLDAFPDKKLTGVVKGVANVGEQMPNTDSKVFKVMVEIDKIDKTLRPGMTTSNNIITQEIDDALFIPLECLHNYKDSISYVYKESGLSYIKQEVQIGETNADAAQILIGLDNSDKVYLTTPVNSDDQEIQLLDELNGKRYNQEPEQESEPIQKAPKPNRPNKPIS